MKSYELTCLVNSEISTEDAQAKVLEISSQIQKEGGLIIKSEGPIPRSLGYKIKGQVSALWVNIEFSLEPDKLNVIEGIIRKDAKIIRHLITIKKPAGQMRERYQAREEKPKEEIKEVVENKTKKEDKKVELKDIDEKLEEILKG